MAVVSLYGLLAVEHEPVDRTFVGIHRVVYETYLAEQLLLVMLHPVAMIALTPRRLVTKTTIGVSATWKVGRFNRLIDR